MFQFTHPGRGATVGVGDLLYRLGVSIHAPREGCDCADVDIAVGRVEFQFTHPGRGATSLSLGDCSKVEFQFTHPGRGATPAGSLRVGG